MCIEDGARGARGAQTPKKVVKNNISPDKGTPTARYCLFQISIYMVYDVNVRYLSIEQPELLQGT